MRTKIKQLSRSQGPEGTYSFHFLALLLLCVSCSGPGMVE